MRIVGLEPTRVSATVFETVSYTSSAYPHILLLVVLHLKFLIDAGLQAEVVALPAQVDSSMARWLMVFGPLEVRGGDDRFP